MKKTHITRLLPVLLAILITAPAGAVGVPDLTATDINCDFLIVYHDDFEGGVGLLEDVKQHQGFNTLCVPTSQIAAQFGDPRDPINPGGNVHPLHIRTFLVSASMTWDGPPRYVLLVGSEEWVWDEYSFDYSRIPFYYPEDASAYRYDESYFVRNPNDNSMRMVIGRLPATTDAEIITYADKLATYNYTYDKGLLRVVGDASASTDQYTDNEFYRDIEEAAFDKYGGFLHELNRARILTSHYTYVDDNGYTQIYEEEVENALIELLGSQDQYGLLWTGGQTTSSTEICSGITGEFWNRTSAEVPVLISVSCQHGKMWRDPGNQLADNFTKQMVNGLFKQGNGGCLSGLGLHHRITIDMFKECSELVYEAIGQKGCRTVGDIWAHIMSSTQSTSDDAYRHWVIFGDPSVELDITIPWRGEQNDGTVFASGVEISEPWPAANNLVAGTDIPDDLTCNVRVPLIQDFEELGKHSIKLHSDNVAPGARAEFRLFDDLGITIDRNTFLSYWVKTEECAGGAGGLILGAAGAGFSTLENPHAWDQFGESMVLANRTNRHGEWVNYIVNLSAVAGNTLDSINLLYEHRGSVAGGLEVLVDNIEIHHSTNMLPQDLGSLGLAWLSDDRLVNSIGDAVVSYVDRFAGEFSHYKVLGGGQQPSGIGAFVTLDKNVQHYSWNGRVRFENSDAAVFVAYDSSDNIIAMQKLYCGAGLWKNFEVKFANPGYGSSAALARVVISPHDNPYGKVFEADNLTVNKTTVIIEDPKNPKVPIVTMGAIGGVRIFPNPFNPQSQIVFNARSAGSGEVAIHDLRGAVVKTLHSGHIAEGDNTFTWNGSDRRGRRVSSGLYFVSCRINGETAIRKICLAK